MTSDQRTSKPLVGGLVGLGITAYLLIVGVGARGLRGSDQWWYAADMALVRAGRGVRSNYITAAVFNSDAYSPESLPPPVHHTPLSYLVAVVARVSSDDYVAWVAINATFALACAGLVYLISRHLTSVPVSALAAVVFLLLPQTVWFTLNPLLEHWLILLFLLTVLGSLQFPRRVGLGLTLMLGGSILLASSRLSFAVLIPVCAVLLLWLWRKEALGLRHVAIYTVLSTGGAALFLTLLEQHPSGPQLYNTDPLVTRVVMGLFHAVVPSSTEEVLMESLTLLGMGIGVLLNLRRGRAASVLVYWTAATLALYLVVAVVFQAQYRYLGPALPLAVILVVAGAARRLEARAWSRSAMVALGCVTLIATMTLGAMTMMSYRSSALTANRAVSVTREAMKEDTGDGSVLMLKEATNGSPLWLTYLVAPRPLLSVGATDEPQACVEASVLHRWQVDTIIASSQDSLDAVRRTFCDPGAAPQLKVINPDVSTPYGDLQLIAVGA